MSNAVIRVEGLGKCYTLNHRQEGQQYKALRDLMAEGAKSIGRRLLGREAQLRADQEAFWALKDVDFEIQQGDRVGIIGRNGAGKSTLLKVLSRIVEPTTGEIRIRGRVASLLEVGTGFHPELTGRENIYLNGAILGMSRAEITRKFDEIVDFAEVEKFLDTPVKRYSSGMYVRLAFAVAAHLEPEILIVDEVLAVGDAQFQKKCLGKMEDVGKEGRTVIFVSHQMSAIQALCDRGIFLQSGQVHFDGPANATIDVYLETGKNLKHSVLSERKDREGSGKVRVVDIQVVDAKNKPVSSLQSGETYTFEIACFNHSDESLRNVILSFDIFDERENILLLFRSNFTNEFISMKPGLNSIYLTLKDLSITIGSYHASIFLSHAEKEVLDYVQHAFLFSIEKGDFFGTGSVGIPSYCKTLTRATWGYERL
jgi:lipopolysaccharide transport system ATP-binding protein